MQTLKFYFQTTLETIILLLFMSAAIFVVDLVTQMVVKTKYAEALKLQIKPSPGTEDFNKFRHPFKPGTL